MNAQRQRLVESLLKKQGTDPQKAEVRKVALRLEAAYLNSVLDGAGPFGRAPSPFDKETGNGEA